MGKSIAWVAPAAVISVAALGALTLDRHVSVVSRALAEELKEAASKALHMRVSPDGSKVDYIETDAGTVISGSGSRVND